MSDSKKLKNSELRKVTGGQDPVIEIKTLQGDNDDYQEKSKDDLFEKILKKQKNK